MPLPQNQEDRFREELERYEQEKQMLYITSIERAGIEKGRQEGRQEGVLLAARDSVLDALEERFGAVPTGLADRIRQTEDPTLLRRLLRRAVGATSLEAFERALVHEPD